jgi:hypothetical protein
MAAALFELSGSHRMTEEIEEPAALRVARFRLQHWQERFAAARVNDDEEELRQATKFIAAYGVLITSLASVARDR